MKKELFDQLVESGKDAGRIRNRSAKPSRVFKYGPIEVKRIRKRLRVSQSQFAMMIGVSKSTLQNWEQGRREPDGPAKALLQVVDKKPKAVLEALRA